MRHELGGNPKQISATMYGNKYMKAIEKYCQRIKRNMPPDDARAFDEKRWRPSKTGDHPHWYRFDGHNKYNAIVVGASSMSLVPLYVWEQILRGFGPLWFLSGAIAFALLYCETLFPDGIRLKISGVD